MYLGVDYYPEHWDINRINKDISSMKKLGVNVVRIGEFAWHLMESIDGNFDFSFFDMVINKLKDNEIKIIFGTPTATFPAWLARKYPSILSKDENQHTHVFGGRRQYCFNSSVYRKYSKRLVRELINHYKEEDSIIAWQIDNEFGHEGSDMCYCEDCHREFQRFLKDKYSNINVMNQVYGSIFWGQTYNDFNEIPLPLKTITTHNPSLLLDWARFRSFSLIEFAREQIELVRHNKGSHQLITTNYAGGFLDKWFDHSQLASYLDFVSYDNYPVWGGLKEPISDSNIGMNLDFIRGLKDRNFWIMEELMGAQGHSVIGYLPRPNQSKMWAYQGFAHGCEHMLFFRWRGMNKGAEQFCYGILDQDNREGRKYQEVQTFFKDIDKYEHVFSSRISSDIALLYDHNNIWAWKFQPQSEAFDFEKEMLRLYEPFYNLNSAIDVIPIDRDITKYKVLLIPALQIIDKELSVRLEHFVSKGGTVIFSFRSGIKDDNNNLIMDQTIPCYIKDITGIEVVQVESLPKGTLKAIRGLDKLHDNKGTCGVWRDMIKPITARVLYNYDDEFYNEYACITRNSYKDGCVYYIGSGVDVSIMRDIAREVVNVNDINYNETEEGLEIYERKYSGEIYEIICNHTNVKKQYKNEEIKAFEGKIIKVVR